MEHNLWRSRDSLLGIVTKLLAEELRDNDMVTGKGKGFSLLQSVRTDFGV